jgi:hypothetical protein
MYTDGTGNVTARLRRQEDAIGAYFYGFPKTVTGGFISDKFVRTLGQVCIQIRMKWPGGNAVDPYTVATQFYRKIPCEVIECCF